MEASKQTIYVGPSLSGSRLAQATTFIGGYPALVPNILDEHPWMIHLFVPVTEYSESMKKLTKKGTALYIFANRCKEV